MKKKILLITCIISTISILSIIIFNSMDNKNNNIMKNIDKDNQIVKENMITMMYETEAGSGNYELTKDTTWPETGYVFNSELSGCEGNGELSWNNENHTVNLLTNTADRCFVYFDKYSGVWIDNVEVSTITGNSITLNVNATSDNGTIVAYYYSINNSQYVESTSNIIQITDLNKVTEYNIKVYAIDSANNRSNIYTLDTTTTADSGPSISFVLINELTANSVTLTVNAISQNNIANYYYSINNNSFVESTNGTYTFNNLNSGTTYNIKIYITDNSGQQSSIYEINVTTIKITYLADYIKGLYTSDGSNGIYYHDGSGTYGSREAGDYSYRYSGSNPNNYVCFGRDLSTCPEDALYRIIGVFGEKVKLIKSTSYGTSRWGGYTAYWPYSGINTTLNSTFLNSFTDKWINMISSNNWRVDDTVPYGFEENNVKTIYNYENQNASKIYNTYIALMYISDYGYAASPSYWSTNLTSYRNAINSNWLYLNTGEWTMATVQPSSSDWAFYISSYGNIDTSLLSNYSDTYNIRPCFYLNSNVTYLSGSGTSTDPILLGQI